MQFTLFESILILLIIAILVSLGFRRYRIPSILGNILVGMLVGPQILDWMHNTENIRNLAEFGIVFLLFTIGLEFSIQRLLAMKRIVFVYGGLQVLLCMVITIAVGLLFHFPGSQAFIIGGIVAMSSTAIVSKLLNEQNELNLPHGNNVVGILLFQDLAAIPILILLANLTHFNSHTLLSDIGWPLFKGIVAANLIIAAGRLVVRPMLYHIAERHSEELFTLTTLLLTLSAAWLTYSMGLSLVLGAFLAGMMLGETEFRHQVEVEIRPFRDVLLALFFISIGMQFNLTVVYGAWYWVLLLLSALILFKGVLIMALGYILQKDKPIAFRTGLVLAQGGEFGFAMLFLAMNNRLVSDENSQIILGAILLSMLISPLLIQYNRKITKYFFRKSYRNSQRKLNTDIKVISKGLKKHIIICGYGRVGQNIARFVERIGLTYIAFDLNSTLVQKAIEAGENVRFANATRYEVLRAARINSAAAVVIGFYGLGNAETLIKQIRKHNKTIPIIARTYDDVEAEKLYMYGATEVIPESLELSIELVSHLLFLMRVPIKQVNNLIHEIREERYELLHRIFPNTSTIPVEAEELEHHTGLYAIYLTETAFAVGHRLRKIKTQLVNVKITKVRRGHDLYFEEDSNIILEKGDVLVVFGPVEDLIKAEKFLLKGKI